MGRHHKKKKTKHVSEIEEREKIRESILKVFRTHLALSDQAGALLVGPSKGKDVDVNKDVEKPAFTASRRNIPESDSSSDSMNGRERKKRRDLTKRKRKFSSTTQKTKKQPEKKTAVSEHIKVARGITYNILSGAEDSKEKHIPVIGPGRLTQKVGIIQTGKKSAPAHRRMTIPDHISRTADEDIKKIVSGDESGNQQTGIDLDQAEGLVFSRGGSSERLKKNNTPAYAPMSNQSNCSSAKSIPVQTSAISSDLQVFDVQDTVTSVLGNSKLKSITKHLYPGRDYVQETMIDLQKILKHFGATLDVSELETPCVKDRNSVQNYDQEQPLPSQKLEQEKSNRYAVETNIAQFEPLVRTDKRHAKKDHTTMDHHTPDSYTEVGKTKHWTNDGDTDLTKALQRHGSMLDKQSVDLYLHGHRQAQVSTSGKRQEYWRTKPSGGHQYQTLFNPTVPSDFMTPYTSWKQHKNTQVEYMIHKAVEPNLPKSYYRSNSDIDMRHKIMESKSDVNSFLVKRPKEFDHMQQLLPRELDQGRLDENKNKWQIKKQFPRYPYDQNSDAFDAFFRDSDQNKADLLASRMSEHSVSCAGDSRARKQESAVDAQALIQTNDELSSRGEPMEVDGKEREVLSLLHQSDMLESISNKQDSQGSIDRPTNDDLLYQSSRSNSQCSQCSRTLDQGQLVPKLPNYQQNPYHPTEPTDAMAAGDMAWQHHRYNRHPKHVLDLMDILDCEEHDHQPSEHGHCKPPYLHQTCTSVPMTRNRNKMTRPPLDSPSSPNMWSWPRKMY